MNKFYLIKCEESIRGNYTCGSLGNHFELIQTDNITDYMWDEQCECANSNWEGCNCEEEYGKGSSENCDCWSEFASNISTRVVEYDATNPDHQAHTGWEDERPEHLVWKEAAIIDAKTKRTKFLSTRILAIRKEQALLVSEIEELLMELEHNA